jgi:hypothetical protein
MSLDVRSICVMSNTLIKAAEEEKAKSEEKPEHPAMTMGKSVAGLGTGLGLGYIGMKGVDEAVKLKQMKAGVPKHLAKGVGPGAAKWALPAGAAVLGMATPYFYQGTVDKMRDNFKKRQGGQAGGSDERKGT